VRISGDRADGKRWKLRHRTDDRGRVRFEGLDPGDVSVEIDETGYVQEEPLVVRVPAGSTAEAAVREDPGRSLDVLVLDTQGRPVSHARLEILWGHAWLDGDVQRLGFWTDRFGRFRFPRVGPKATRLRVTYGSRWAYVDFDRGAGIVVHLKVR
jgi:hypothetical protein